MLGGNISPTPGEISLAHHGVLFLDELPEFKRSVLETMRQPLEDGRVTISRAAGTMTFPAQFMLVAAMNPTPDGKMPGESRSSPRDIQNYLGRISGPLLDRIDLHVEVPAVKFREISSERTGETSAQIRERVIAARKRQQERFKARPRIPCNARMGSRELKQYCALDEAALDLLRAAMTDKDLSARAYDRILKVARTIADLAGAEALDGDHISEAIQYRSLDRQLWDLAAQLITKYNAQDPEAAARLPKDKGSYVLIAVVCRRKRLEIGRLGCFTLVPGYYAYVGSAFGPGGLRARLGHHLRSTAAPHWHIDYLLSVAEPVELWCAVSARKLEQELVEWLAGFPGFSQPIAGFGSSDDRGHASHLFYSRRRPTFARADVRRLGLGGVEGAA